MQHTQGTSRNGALDGLRTLSILGILLYHLNLPWLPSGHMGVVMFLVLSGYLATNAVVRTIDSKAKYGFTDVLRAWGRRLVRILPSVLALVAIVGTLCATLNHVLFTKMRPDMVPSIGFYLNWSYILRDVSYFDLIGGTSPLLHLWYLACDLQFFAAWTLILPLLLKRGKPFARRGTFLLALASAAWMAYLFTPGADPSRVYYGTDTRAFSLLLGCWLALWFPLGKEPLCCRRLFVKERNPQKYEPGTYRATVWAHLLGLLSLAGIVAAMLLIPRDSDIWYRGGMLGFSFVAALLLATLLCPTTIVGALLGLAPLRVLGQRSFAIYLWHYPVILLMNAHKDTTDWWMRLAAVGVSIVAAELSLRLVERPFNLAHKTWTESDNEKDEKKVNRIKIAVFISSLCIIACGMYTCQAYDTTPTASLVPQEALVSTGTSAGEAMDLSQGTQGQSEVPEDDSSTKEADTSAREPVEVTQRTIVAAPANEVAANKYDPVLIGDSVPGDAGNEFVAEGFGWEKRLPNSLIDTFIGRNPNQSLDVLRGYLDQGVVGKVVVMACFSNSTPSPETLDAMIEAAGAERQIYLVGTVNPDGFQEAANANLQAAADAHDNVHYVDWPAVLDGHMDEYLWADATHLRPEGALVYVDMVVHAVAQDLVDAGGTATEG